MNVHRRHPVLAVRRNAWCLWAVFVLACALAAIWTAVALR